MGGRAETESQRSQPSQAARSLRNTGARAGPQRRRGRERREDGWGDVPRPEDRVCRTVGAGAGPRGQHGLPPRLRQAGGAGLGLGGGDTASAQAGGRSRAGQRQVGFRA